MRRPRSAGPLTPAELAEAAVLGDLSVALLFLGWLLPVGIILQVLSVAPLAALASRRRPRAVVAAGIASSSVAFLFGGAALWSLALLTAVLGLVIGMAARRGWGWPRLLLAVLPVWAAAAGVTVGQLLLFANLRRLALAQIRNSWHGVRSVISHARFLHPLVTAGNTTVSWILGHWWAVIPVSLLVLIEGGTLVAAAVGRPAIRRVERALGPPTPRAPVTAHSGTPGPVPAVLDQVAYRYPEADAYALAGVDLEIPAHSLVVVVGRNGSGKSTLARVVAGLVVPEGELRRPGGPGLGVPGGTAVVFQRPESQVLGIRIRDDVVWGMGPAAAASVDVAGVLELVGLGGMDEEETGTLSGGQLQRLALAAALARKPSLLISDESTSMLDPEGRRQVAELLVRLARDQGLTVLHVTHRRDEMAAADVTVRVDAGRVEVGVP